MIEFCLQSLDCLASNCTDSEYKKFFFLLHGANVGIVFLEADGVPCVQQWITAAASTVRSELWVWCLILVASELSQYCINRLIKQSGQPRPAWGEWILQYHQCTWAYASGTLGMMLYSFCLFFHMPHLLWWYTSICEWLISEPCEIMLICLFMTAYSC